MLTTRGGATLFMSRGDGIVLSMRAPGQNERVEIARIDDTLYTPHLVEVDDNAYFLSDTRTLYRLDTERLTVKRGLRLDADKVLPLVGLSGVAYAAYIVDGPSGYETKIARLEDEWTLTERTSIRGELVRLWSRDGHLRAAGARGVGRMFDLVWEPGLGRSGGANLATITDRPSIYGRRVLPPSQAFEETPREDSGMIRPEPMSDRPSYDEARAQYRNGLHELEGRIDRVLPGVYHDLYDLAFSDPMTRERLQRIGLYMIHPMLRTRAQMAQGLLPLAEVTDDSLLCLDVTDEILMPVLKVFRDDRREPVGHSLALYLEELLTGASSVWPTTVREIRRALESVR